MSVSTLRGEGWEPHVPCINVRYDHAIPLVASFLKVIYRSAFNIKSYVKNVTLVASFLKVI